MRKSSSVITSGRASWAAEWAVVDRGGSPRQVSHEP